jgi:hypothetical protein
MSPRHNDESHSLNQPVRSVHLAAQLVRARSDIPSREAGRLYAEPSSARLPFLQDGSAEQWSRRSPVAQHSEAVARLAA